MEKRIIQVKINAASNYCTDGGTHEQCSYMKETYLCNKFCEIFKQRLIFDEEVNAYIRTIECIGAEQGKFPSRD